MMGSARYSAAAALLGLAVPLMLAAGTRAAGAGTAGPVRPGSPVWRVVSAPSVRGWDSLNSVSASSSGDAWAVGSVQRGRESVLTPLAEHWDGRAWHIVAAPGGVYSYSNGLNAVSVYSATDAWAVGTSEGPPVHRQQQAPLALHWNGHSWATVATPVLPQPGGQFNAVADLGPGDAWAVGHAPGATGATSQTLIEHYDGRAWHIVPSPNPGTDSNALWQVAAAGPDDIWATGEQSNGPLPALTLAEHWDGQRWRVVPTPDDPAAQFNYIRSLAAGSATDAWAAVTTAGNAYGHFFMHWNGQRWQMLTGLTSLRGDIALSGLTIVSPAQVWVAGGFDGTLSARWDGRQWRRVATPDPGNSANLLNSITAVPGSNELLAVGYWANTTSLGRPLVLAAHLPASLIKP